MELIFEGKLSAEEHLKDVLQRIIMNEIRGACMLRITAPDLKHSGRIVFADCRYIVAALTKDSLNEGYEAVRAILESSTGSYAFLKIDDMDQLDIVPNLHIPLAQIVNMLPGLPEDPRSLYDEKSLLDRIFHSGQAHETLPVKPRGDMDDNEYNHPITGTVKTKKNWNVLDSVIYADEDGETGNLTPPKPRSEPEFVELDAEAIREQVAQERNQRYVRKSQRPAFRTSPLLVVSLVFVLFVSQLGALLFWPQVASYLKHAAKSR